MFKHTSLKTLNYYLFVMLLFSLACGSSKAQIVVWEATGILDGVDLSNGLITEFPDAMSGQGFSVKIEFDSASPFTSVTSGSQGVGYRYTNALVSITLTIGGKQLNRAQLGFEAIDLFDDFAFLVLNDPPVDGVAFFSGVEPAMQGGFAQLTIVLRGPEHLDIFTGPGLPSQPDPRLTDLALVRMQLIDGSDFVTGAVTSVQNIADVVDDDQDAVNDLIDNCLLVGNTDQRDTNGDGFGNRCDPDTNNDCRINFADVSLFAPTFLTADPDHDFNGDNIVNFTDYSLLTTNFLGQPGPSALAVCP